MYKISGKRNLKITLYIIILCILLMLILIFLPSSKMELDEIPKEKLLTASMYKILGMLDEYNGRFNMAGKPIENFVESFDSDEKEIADYFDQCIQDFRNESKINFEYTRSKEGRVFESPQLSKIINSFYLMDKNIAALDINIVKRASKEKKLLYIEGVYKRYRKSPQNLILMANAEKKLNTVALILKELQCHNILIFKSEFSVPASSCVIFKPSPTVMERLEIQQILTQKDIEEDGYFHLYKKIN